MVDDERPVDPAASVYLSNTAITRGRPAITTEIGCLGRVGTEDLALLERCVAGVLRHLRMRNDGPPACPEPEWLRRNVVMRAGATGILSAAVERQDFVEQGTIVARITDFHGNVLQEIRAPLAGEVMYIVDTPPISKGEPIGMISSIG